FALNFVGLVRLDEVAETLTGYPAVAPAVRNDPDQLAYVMYTSGSTGVPKGVAVTHGDVVRVARDPNDARLSVETVMLQSASLAFDAATFEIWGALFQGARLVLAPAKAPDRIPDLVMRHQVETLWLTTQVFPLLVDLHLESLAEVRQV